MPSNGTITLPHLLSVPALSFAWESDYAGLGGESRLAAT